MIQCERSHGVYQSDATISAIFCYAGFVCRFLSLYELTHEAEYLSWAEHACDVCLTYVVVWDMDMPPGRLGDHRFKTRGWTVVSPQNQHIDQPVRRNGKRIWVSVIVDMICFQRHFSRTQVALHSAEFRPRLRVQEIGYRNGR